MAPLPNGDLLVGTRTNTVYIIPNAESAGVAGKPKAFIQLSDNQLQSVWLAPNGFIYIAGQYTLYKVPYQTGDQSEPPSSAVSIAMVRQGGIPANSDGDVHVTSSVAVTDTTVYLSVGSSCNACTEIDPTRATIQVMGLDGENMHTLATRIRNAIAVTINPNTGTLWAGGAGQDDLPFGHPYEFMDPVTTHLLADGGGIPIDYGWNDCEENQNNFGSGADCSGTVAPLVEFTAYMTHIGATFYVNTAGAYAFPGAYQGGMFVASHGSWHGGSPGQPSTPPNVSFVAMNGDEPVTAVNWSDPTVQSTVFLGGMGKTNSTNYSVRATGVAVGPQGSLFVGDDQNNAVYRIRPNP